MEQQKNIEFIRLIKQNPCIYNYSDPNYIRTDIKEKIWTEIAKKMGEEPTACKDRWKNIRTVFVRRQVVNTKDFKRRYYLEEELQFLLPFLKSHNLKKQKKDEDFYASEETNGSPDFPEKIENFYFDADAEENIADSSNLGQNSIRYSSPEPSNSENEAMPVKKSTFHKRSYPENRLLKPKRQKIELSEDSDKLFLLSILPDMRQLNMQQKRQFKRGIMDLIDNILEGPIAQNTQNAVVNIKTESIESDL